MSGSQCCENPPSLSSSSGAGQVQEFGGLTSYVSGPADSSSAVILVSDVFGFEAPNLRKLADKVAAAGFYTVVPDFLHGDPYVPVPEKPFSIWIKDHGPFTSFKQFHLFVKQNKLSYFIHCRPFEYNFVIAKVVVELAKYAYIQAGVLLHPSFVSLEDIQGVKVPISVLGAEIDQMSPPELLKQFEAALNAKPEVEGFVKIFPGVSHGWSVRYKDDDELEVKSAEEAHKDMLDWLVKHLK
ncbi:hypothetical protein DH2020_035804 [Rehmannia glutinosa]|uniref:Dienelactone hydrolase domain-containing protein n=1 Tax=Rehmannia glutinosa TaxID=99300 RepID=A0ABR0V8G7_REHGL